MPFEKKFYDKYGVNSIFVGHPIAKVITNESKRNHTLLLLPGSRLKEINALADTMLLAAQKIAKVTNLDIHIVAANEKIKQILTQKMDFLAIKSTISFTS